MNVQEGPQRSYSPYNGVLLNRLRADGQPTGTGKDSFMNLMAANASDETINEARPNENTYSRSNAWLLDRMVSKSSEQPSYGTGLSHAELQFGVSLPFANKTAIPTWYADLAKPDQSKDLSSCAGILNEYHALLGEAMNLALDKNCVPANDWEAYRKAVLDDRDKSERIHQDVRSLLADNPRASYLMAELGI